MNSEQDPSKIDLLTALNIYQATAQFLWKIHMRSRHGKSLQHEVMQKIHRSERYLYRIIQNNLPPNMKPETRLFWLKKITKALKEIHQQKEEQWLTTANSKNEKSPFKAA